MLPSLNGGWVATTVFLVVFVILYPLVLAVIVRRKLHVSWRYFGYGALIFFLFQLISRVPLVVILGQVLAPQLKSSQMLLWIWLFVLAATAALFEEVGRYIGYRWLMKREEKTWDKAVMYGLGHGGLESILFVGGLALLTLVNVLVMSTATPGSLPAAQHAQAVQTITAINAQPAWTSLLGAWERLWTVPIQVALSVIVLQVFRRGKISWLWLALLAHFVVDFTAVAIVQVLGPGINTNLLVEGVVGVFGLLALWIIWSLRDRPEQVASIANTSIASDTAS
jgi:uncharacterized membrane protein YhfC